MSKRPITTLFMLESLDGKISTGNNDCFDVDKDFPRISGVKEGLHQYYEIEENTDKSNKIDAKYSDSGTNVFCVKGDNLKISFKNLYNHFILVV